MSQRISFLVHGKVQGVFFRDHTQQAANKYGLTGSVRNTDDGKVASTTMRRVLLTSRVGTGGGTRRCIIDREVQEGSQ